MERFVIFPFNNKFVSAETKASHPFQSNYKLANPDVEAWIREPRYMDALLWIVFSHYQVEDVKIPEEMTEKKEMLMQDSGEDMLTDIFVFTADRRTAMPIMLAWSVRSRPSWTQYAATRAWPSSRL
jgi:hypothetical protein